MESFHEAWDLICDYCKAHITDVAYKTWQPDRARQAGLRRGGRHPDGAQRVSPADPEPVLYAPVKFRSPRDFRLGHQHYLYHSQRGRRKEGGPKRQPGYRLGI